jgi:hypothetical protein
MSEDMNMRMLLAVLAISMTHAACDRSSRPSAADDPQRSVGGSHFLSENETQPLATGPFFLTDVMIDGGSGRVITSRDAACKDKDAEDRGALFEWNFPIDASAEARSHHGMRLLIAQGKTVCLKVFGRQTRLVWAGFRP